MRCIACNKELNPVELKLKMPDTDRFADLCYECYAAVVTAYDDDFYDSLDEDEFIKDNDGYFTFSGWEYE